MLYKALKVLTLILLSQLLTLNAQSIVNGSPTQITPLKSNKVINNILILSPEGYDPNIDTVGINDLIKKVTEAASKALIEELSKHNKICTFVLDQSIKYKAGEKLAIHTIKYNSDAAIILTLESEQKKDGTHVSLKMQFANLEYILKDSKAKGVIPFELQTKLFPLSTPSGWVDASISAYARDFVEFLIASNKI